jgi:acyl-coenzyme A thioesterase PaaI-like protein
MKKRHMRWFLNFYPPFLGAGIRIKRLDDDWKAIDVEMKLHRWNSNYVGTHFGGSLYSMTDPFYMLMLMANLGDGYIVWDKAATVRFRKPGRGKMLANFRLSEEQVEDIRQRLMTQEKIEPTFTVEVKDESGTIIAEVDKLIYVRKKRETPAGA